MNLSIAKPLLGTAREPLDMSTNGLELKGYASRFDQLDLSSDQVRRGAFASSLLTQPSPIPMLFNHETDNPIGVWNHVVEDEVGLYVEGLLFTGDERTSRIKRLVESGGLSGLSIGFRTNRYTRRSDGGRDLLDIELWEVSIVAFPMLPSARLTEISSAVPLVSTLPDDIVHFPQADETIKESMNG
ncbi:MAG: HK97 family phage prohead protease [Maricaulaceae bacterium]